MIADALVKPALIAAGVLALAAAAAAGVQTWRLSAAQETVETLRAAVATARAERDLLAAANGQLASQVDRQNAAVREVVAQAEQANRAAQTALALASRQIGAAQALGDGLQRLAQSAPGDECARTFAVIDAYRRERVR